MVQKRTSSGWTKLAGQAVIALAFAGGIAALLLWLAGKFAPKVPTTAEPAQSAEGAIGGRVEAARTLRVPKMESAVGTIRAVHETTIGSKLMARVVEVSLKAGQHVSAGEVLIRLDDANLLAQLEQAEATAASAEATHAQAIKDDQRYAALLKSSAVSRQDYEKAATALKSAEAELRRAGETVNEVQATLAYATIRAPMDGTVIDKKVDVGDMVMPGQVLLTMFDPQRMQLVASVRESLAQRLSVDQEIGVEIEGLSGHYRGQISEIVPEARTASRAFQVKVSGSAPKGVYPGMFARMLIPLEEEEVLVVPRTAVRHVGQLELVDVVDHGHASRRAVRSGRTFGENVEILSGLRAGERVLLPRDTGSSRGDS